MSRLLTVALAAAFTTCLSTVAWSLGGQAGGASGGGGASGSAGTSDTAGAAGQAGTAGGAQSGAGQVGAGQADAGQVGTGQPGNAQLGVGYQGSNIGRTPFFTDRGARQQLNLDDNRFNTLNRAYQQEWNRYNQGLTGLDRNLPEQQRMQRMMQLENQFNQNFNRSLDTTFTDPALRQRFSQLNWQYQGFNAFNDPTVRQRLDITPQQQRQFRQLNAEWRRQLQQMRRAGNNNDPALTQRQFQQMQQQYQQQLDTLLTPEQQQAWTGMLGQRYQYPPDIFFNEFNGDPNAVVPYSAGRPGVGAGSQLNTQDNQVPSAADQDTQAQGTNEGTLR